MQRLKRSNRLDRIISKQAACTRGHSKSINVLHQLQEATQPRKMLQNWNLTCVIALYGLSILSAATAFMTQCTRSQYCRCKIERNHPKCKPMRKISVHGEVLCLALQNGPNDDMSQATYENPSFTQTSTTESNFTPTFYFMRPAQFVDLGFAGNMLTEAFFSQGRNFFSYQIEKFKTILHLESTFNAKLRDDKHLMIVACKDGSGKVIGFAELDGNPVPMIATTDETIAPRPYMCNLVVDKKWRRKGIANTLIRECERVAAVEWSQECIHLKVSGANSAAIDLYKCLGYGEQSSHMDVNRGETVLLFRKDLTPGKIEDIREECEIALEDNYPKRLLI